MNILVISGGSRKFSNSRGVAQYAWERLRKQVDSVNYFDVRQHMLPVYTGDESQDEHPEVIRLREYAREADGFFFCTPEYHNGISGALKNALDYLGKSHFQMKPVLITATAGGGKGGINALNNLRLVLRGVFALPLPQQVVFDPDAFNHAGELQDRDGMNRLDGLVDELIAVTSRLRCK